MVHRKTISRISLSSLLAMIFILMLSTFGVSAATISTTVSGTGSITQYTNFVEVTNPATMVSDQNYYFSNTPISVGTALTSIPDGCAVLSLATFENNSITNAAGDGYTIQQFVNVIEAGDGFDTCTSGGILYGTVNSFSGMDGTPGTGWYYWCDGGAVHGLGPFYCYSCDTETLTPADAVVTMNSNFNADTTTINASMFSALFDGQVLDSVVMTDASVNLATGDYTFSFTDGGFTFNVTIDTYTVTYNTLGGGTVFPATATTWAGYSVELPDVTTTHTLTGWYTLGGSKVGDAGDAYTPANDITLYAHYTDYYSAFFVNQDGTLYGFSTGESGDLISYPLLVTPTKEGYTFDGFETSGGTSYSVGNTFTGDVVYYAQWDPLTYDVSYDAGTYTYTITADAGGSYTYDQVISLIVPTKTDYVFVGWEDATDNNLFGNVADTSVNYTIAGETTLTARFEEDIDSFKLVGFLDATTGHIYKYYYRHVDETDVTAPAAPTKDGYTFVQWTNYENSTDTLNPGDTVDFSLNTESGEKTYAAEWLGDAQTLSYSGALDSSTHVDSAFDSGNSGETYRTGDTITFDCTGTATADDNDNVVPEDNYLISELHLSYTIDGTPYDVTLFPDEEGICTFTVPAADAGISYYAIAERYIYQIEDMTDGHTTPAVAIDGVSAAFLGGVVDAEAGATVDVSFTTTSGYTLDESTIVIECGGVPLYYDKGTNGTTDIYEFTMPAGDVEIYAESYYDAHTISLVTQNSTVDSLVDTTLTSDITAGTTLVPAGDTVTFTASPISSYTITNIMVQDLGTMEYLLVSYDPISGEYSFTMPSAAVKITITAEVDKASLVILDYDNTLLGIAVVNEGSTVDVDNTAGTIEANGNTYTASTVPGYEFSQWEITANGDQFNSSSSISDYMIVKATYDPLDYDITLASDSSDDAEVTVTYSSGTGVTLTPTGTTTYTGDEIYVTATPDPNYEITGVAVRAADGSITVVDTKLISKDPATGAWTYSFVMPSYDVEIAAYTEAIPYHLTVNELTFPEGGKYTIDGKTTTNADIEQGEQTVISVDPEPGYMIEHIAVYYQVGASRTYLIDEDNAQLYDNDPANDLDTELPYDVTITMPAHDVTVDITYAKVNYTLTTTCVEATWGSFVGIPATANVGDVIDFTVVANYGYNLKTLTILYGALGITPTETATPTVDGSGNTTYYYEFTMPASNVNLTATFVKDMYTVTFIDYDGKTLEMQTVDYLGVPTLPTISLVREGYTFIGWQRIDPATGLPTGNVCDTQAEFDTDFIIERATTLQAVYEVNNYDITYTSGGNGDVDGDTDADYQATATFTVTPDTGYQIDQVKATYYDLNNIKRNIEFETVAVDKVAGGDYTFTMPAIKDGTVVAVTATFTEITYTAYLDNVDYADVTLNGVDAEDYHINADYTDTVTIKVKPYAGYELTGLTVTAHDGVSPDVTVTPAVDPAGGSYTFTMPYYDVDVNVTIEPIEYSVTWNNDAHSDISNNIPGDYDYNSTVAFTVTPDTGYQIKSVKGYYYKGDTEIGSVHLVYDESSDPTTAISYTFTIEREYDVHIEVVTEPIIYDVHVAVNGDGTYRLNDPDADVTWTTAAYGSTVKIIPEPALGWELDSIVASNTDAIVDNGDGTYTLSMDNPEDVLVTITYIQTTYDIGYNTPANGTISVNDTTMQYQHDASFTVTPAEGYQIKSVVGTYTDEDGHDQTITFKSEPTDMTSPYTYTFTMPAADVSIVVEFEPITYQVVTDSVTGNGEVRLDSTDTANITADYGETVTVTATPADGWYLSALTVTNDTTSDPVTYSPALLNEGGDYTFTMPASDVSIDVVFAQITYDISTNYIMDQGTVDVQDTAVENEKVSFTVTPNYGYEVNKVYYKAGDGAYHNLTPDSDGKYNFTMPAKDIIITALFEKLTYQVTFVDYNEKAIGETQYIDYLDPATAPTDPVREGYTFTGWDKDFSSVTEDMVITAQYQVNTPTVTVVDTANGVTNVDNATPAYGTTVTVTADPADGYRFDSISVVTEGGMTVPQTFISEDLDYVTTYTFTMPDDNVTVTVEYTEEASSDYTDVRTDAWFYEAVKFVTDRGYFYGVAEDIFAPRDNMTRAMFVTVLGRLAKVDTDLYTVSAFEDVDINTWYGPYVAWAAANNIVSGYGDTNSNGQSEFGPNNNVTREQMAAIMYRYAEFGSYDLSGKNEEWMDKYIDSNLASSYATDAIAWSVGNGIIQGYSVSETEWKINPQGLATRAEVAQVIRNFVDKVIYK